MKIYLDNDVPRAVESLLDHLGEVKRAQRKGWHDVEDPAAYCLAVRAGFDLVVTCNTSQHPSRQEGGFITQVLDHLKCRVDELPVPIHPLWEKGVGNDFAKLLRGSWPDHLASIEAVGERCGHAHEKRRAEAVRQLERLEQRAGLQQAQAGAEGPDEPPLGHGPSRKRTR